MSRFNVKKSVNAIVERHEKDVAEYTEKVKEENQNLTNAIVNMGSAKVGGAGTGVLVETPAYKKWLTNIQSNNPFIGKSYMQKATEYERDDEDAKGQSEMTDEEAAKIMFKDENGKLHIRDDYDPNCIDEEVENEKLTGDASKFADLCEIRKIVAPRLTWDFDSLLAEVEAKLEELHADEDDYVLPENLGEQLQAAIDHAKNIEAITWKAEGAKKEEEPQKEPQKDVTPVTKDVNYVSADRFADYLIELSYCKKKDIADIDKLVDATIEQARRDWPEYVAADEGEINDEIVEVGRKKLKEYLANV